MPCSNERNDKRLSKAFANTVIVIGDCAICIHSICQNALILLHSFGFARPDTCSGNALEILATHGVVGHSYEDIGQRGATLPDASGTRLRVPTGGPAHRGRSAVGRLPHPFAANPCLAII